MVDANNTAEQSATETMAGILRRLKEQTDMDSQSRTIERLHSSMIDDDGETSDASSLDFVMADGIELVASVLRDNNFPPLRKHQGFCILFTIANDSACHWRCLNTTGQILQFCVTYYSSSLS
jgi:hypothetical protein